MKDRVDRDEALARLGATLLQRHGEGLAAECPGADIVAGYLDRSLDEVERARWEEHFAGCARCQEVLAGLARIELPMAPVEPERQPWAFWSLLRWQWLAPAAAVLAVGVVWTIVRPAFAPVSPLPSQVSTQRAEPSAAVGTGTAAVETEQLREPTRLAKSEKDVAPTGRLDELTRAQTEPKEAAAPPPVSRSKPEAPAPSAPVIAQNQAVAPSKETRTGAVPVGQVADAAKPAAAPAPAERAAFEPGVAGAGAARVMAAADAVRPLPIVVASPGGIAWRVGEAGNIERSVDGQRTWQKQDSGVTANLLGGSAPSATVCWVVGQQGTILRTTDGRTWVVINPPAAVDLVSVSARDSMVAAVGAADGRKFSTSDGGRTWQTP